MSTKKLYLAYGANTNLAQMALRCPQAEYISTLTLNHHQLVFRGVADVIPVPGAKTSVALWLITPTDEQALDRFEGFPRLYVKKYVRIRISERWHRAMLYVMRGQRAQTEAPPFESYEACLRKGYEDCGMPAGQIDAAIRRARLAQPKRSTPLLSANWSPRNTAPSAVRWAPSAEDETFYAPRIVPIDDDDAIEAEASNGFLRSILKW